MIKNKILDHLNTARISHIAWVDKAQSLVYGSTSISKNQLPLEATNCNFGRWFFKTGQILFCIMSEKLVKSVEEKHEELHNSYLKIFQIYFEQKQESSLLLRQPKNITPSSQQEAEEELRNLENISEELIDLLNRIESNFIHLEDDDLTNLCQ
jgi:hypothetical protein